MFVRPARGRRRSIPLLFTMLIAQLNAGGRFFVTQSCLIRRTTPLRETAHHNFKALLFTRDFQSVANLDVARCFDAFAVHMHPATRYGIGGLRTALEETRMPQPLVQPQLQCAGRCRVLVMLVTTHIRFPGNLLNRAGTVVVSVTRGGEALYALHFLFKRWQLLPQAGEQAHFRRQDMG